MPTQMLYESVIEVDERLHILSDKEERLATDVKGVSGDFIRVAKPLDVEALKSQLQVRSNRYSHFPRQLTELTVFFGNRLQKTTASRAWPLSYCTRILSRSTS